MRGAGVMKKRLVLRKVLCAVLSAMIMTCAAVSVTVSATNEPSAIVSEQGSGDEDGGSVNSNDTFAALRDATTIKSEDIEKGAAIASPIVKIINIAVSILVALLMAWILFNSVVDLMCLCVSPFSKRVMALNTNPQQVPQDWMTTIASLASEQAAHALMLASGGAAAAQQSGGGSGAMGGYGMNGGGYGMNSGGFGMNSGGFGMNGGGYGMNGGGAAATPAKPKSTLPIYLRKRVVMLVLFGICIVVFTCTAFTDIGIKFGNMILNAVSGYGG